MALIIRDSGIDETYFHTPLREVFASIHDDDGGDRAGSRMIDILNRVENGLMTRL